MFKSNFINKFLLYFFPPHLHTFFLSICAPSPWPYHQLMNMHDHFTYCVTLAKQTVLEGGFSSSVQHEITVGKWWLIRVQTGDQEKCFETYGKADFFQS